MAEEPLEGALREVPDLFHVPGQERVLEMLTCLTSRPPKVLLVEGGSAEEREKLGLYWTALLNCEAESVPCRECLSCRRIQDGVFLDLVYLDGREGRIGIDAVRDLRGLLGQAPRSGKRRVVVLGEAQELTMEAANALLKSMEETETRNAYVLLTPQRERLLPTLVSRSWVATLAWSLEETGRTEMCCDGLNQEWAEAFSRFLKTGQGWFARTMVKSQVDRSLAFEVIHASRRSLIKACLGCPHTDISHIFLDQGHPQAWRCIDLRLDEAEEALRAQVAPALVLDWLAVGIRHCLKR